MTRDLQKNPFKRSFVPRGDDAEASRAKRPAGQTVRWGVTIYGELSHSHRKGLTNLNIGYKGGTIIDLTGKQREKDRVVNFLREQCITFEEGVLR